MLTWQCHKRRILVRIGGEDLLSWNGADPAQTLHMLLQAVARLLHPEVGDSPSLGVGEVRPHRSAWASHTFARELTPLQ